jgi:hypothetical protein
MFDKFIAEAEERATQELQGMKITEEPFFVTFEQETTRISRGNRVESSDSESSADESSVTSEIIAPIDAIYQFVLIIIYNILPTII